MYVWFPIIVANSPPYVREMTEHGFFVRLAKSTNPGQSTQSYSYRSLCIPRNKRGFTSWRGFREAHGWIVQVLENQRIRSELNLWSCRVDAWTRWSILVQYLEVGCPSHGSCLSHCIIPRRLLEATDGFRRLIPLQIREAVHVTYRASVGNTYLRYFWISVLFGASSCWRQQWDSIGSGRNSVQCSYSGGCNRDLRRNNWQSFRADNVIERIKPQHDCLLFSFRGSLFPVLASIIVGVIRDVWSWACLHCNFSREKRSDIRFYVPSVLLWIAWV